VRKRERAECESRLSTTDAASGREGGGGGGRVQKEDGARIERARGL